MFTTQTTLRTITPLAELKDRHLTETATRKNRKEKTVEDRDGTISRFIRVIESHVGKRAFLPHLTEECLDLYLRHYKNTCEPSSCQIIHPVRKTHAARPRATRTHDKELTHIQMWLEWLYVNGHIPCNFAKEWHAIREPNRATKKQFIGKSGRDQAFQANIDINFILAYVFMFGWNSALRASSLTSMTVGDYDPTPSHKRPNGVYSYINEKVKDKRWTKPIDPEMAVFMARYLELYRLAAIKAGYLVAGGHLDPEWSLFPQWKCIGRAPKGGRQGIQVVPSERIPAMSARVREGLERAGMHEHGNAAHPFRRGRAEYVYRLAGIRAAMVLLDHSDERVTRKYLDIDEDINELSDTLQTIDAEPEKTEDAPTNVVAFRPRAARV